MTKREQQARMRRRIARGWMAKSKPADVIDSIVLVLRGFGPRDAAGIQGKLFAIDSRRKFSIEYLDKVMAAEAARDWRSRRLRPATGYPDGYYISFDTNEDRR